MYFYFSNWSSLTLPGRIFRETEDKMKSKPYVTSKLFITGHNEVGAKVMFLQVSVILLTGGSPAGRAPPRQGDPPGRETPWQGDPPYPRQGETPPTTETPQQGEPPPSNENPPGRENPPPAGRTPPRQGEPPPRHTVNERPVRILLECILVLCIGFKRKLKIPPPLPPKKIRQFGVWEFFT